MPIRKGKKEGDEYAPKTDFNLELIELFRRFRICFEDLKIDTLFPDLEHMTSLSDIRDGLELEGEIGKQAQEAFEYTKQCMLALMSYASKLYPKRSLDNEVVRSLSKELESTPAHFLFDTVETEWLDLMGYIVFLDEHKIALGFNDANMQQLHVKRIMESGQRKRTMKWLSEWRGKYAESLEEGPDDSIAAKMTREELTVMKWPRMLKLGKELKIENPHKLGKIRLKKRIGQCLGYIAFAEGDEKSIGMPPQTAEQTVTTEPETVEA